MGWILEKSVNEFKDYIAEMKDSWQRKSWKKRILDFPVDLLTELYRRMPYTLGHLTFICLVLTHVFDWNVRSIFG